MDFVTFNSFTKNMLSKGLTPSTQILSIRKIEANENLAQKLKLELGEGMIVIKRLRLVDETQFRLKSRFCPKNFARG